MSTEESKFAALRKIRSDRQNEPEIDKPRIGRPPGRRSNPDYTQISAYIPLSLLHAVQAKLNQEMRQQRHRTPRPTCDVIEELLEEWLKR